MVAPHWAYDMTKTEALWDVIPFAKARKYIFVLYGVLFAWTCELRFSALLQSLLGRNRNCGGMVEITHLQFKAFWVGNVSYFEKQKNLSTTFSVCLPQIWTKVLISSNREFGRKKKPSDCRTRLKLVIFM